MTPSVKEFLVEYEAASAWGVSWISNDRIQSFLGKLIARKVNAKYKRYRRFKRIQEIINEK